MWNVEMVLFIFFFFYYFRFVLCVFSHVCFLMCDGTDYTLREHLVLVCSHTYASISLIFVKTKCFMMTIAYSHIKIRHVPSKWAHTSCVKICLSFEIDFFFLFFPSFIPIQSEDLQIESVGAVDLHQCIGEQNCLSLRTWKCKWISFGSSLSFIKSPPVFQLSFKQTHRIVFNAQ